jgi:hypothetical protein
LKESLVAVAAAAQNGSMRSAEPALEEQALRRDRKEAV